MFYKLVYNKNLNREERGVTGIHHCEACHKQGSSSVEVWGNVGASLK